MTDQKTAPGRPRSKETESRILEAAIDLLAEEGYGGLSMDKVAERAQSTKPSIYRRWSSKNELVVAAVTRAFSRNALGEIDTGSVVEDIKRRMNRMTVVLTKTKLGSLMPDIIAQTSRDEDLRTLFSRLEVERRAFLLSALDRGIERGELKKGAPKDLVPDLLLGALYLRAYIIHKPLNARYSNALVEAVLAPYLTEKGQRRS